MKTTCFLLLSTLFLLASCGNDEPKTVGMEIYEYYPDGTVKSIGNYIDGKQRKRSAGFRIAETYRVEEMYSLLDTMGLITFLTNDQNGYLRNCIGYATPEQKNKIDRILAQKSSSKFMKDVSFAWSMNPDKDMNGLYSLYALKPASAMEINMTYKDLAEVVQEKDEERAQIMLNVTLTNAGKAKFGQLTSENIGRPLAIVFNDLVLSAPIVNEVITGGKLVIAGDFTVQEADEMAGILNNSVLNGEYREYHPNGKLKTIMHFENGEQTGSYSRYDETGKLIKKYG